MQKRPVRVTVLTLLLVVNLAAALSLWYIQRRSHELTNVEDAVGRRIDDAISRVGAIGTAQQGYVAPGQLDDPWFERMSMLLDELKRDLAAVRPVLRSTDATTAFTALSDSLGALVGADQRIRENLSGGQELMAADVIFSDGRNLVDAITANLREMQSAERARTRLELAALESERWTVLGVTALLWFGVVMALMRATPAGAAQHADTQGRETTRPLADRPAHTLPVDLTIVAALCTDLSRVTDARALSELLGRAASLLDASGVTLWLGAGEQLFAVLGHGYTPQTLARFGPIARNADNAVARAWRTGHAATIRGNRTAGGATVAPMFGSQGCIGVLAVENRPGCEFDSALQPIAVMIAAQVATAVSAWPAESVSQPVPDTSQARPA